MSKRIPIPKGVRFEVFKRDSFRCQYCGRSAPDVILEVDHIMPVAEGGTNDPLNLITACRDCNRGKSAKTLEDTAAIDRQKRQLDDLNEMREQTEMLIEWKRELMVLSEKQIDAIDELIISFTAGKMALSEDGRRMVKDYLQRFGFSNVYEATEIAFAKYFVGDAHSFGLAVKKIGGVCYNKAKQRESGDNAQ